MESGEKSAKKSNLRPPFAEGHDPRRGRGPKKGAPNAGRPPDWLKKEMAEGRATAVQRLNKKLTTGQLDSDQELRLVKEWAPPEDQQSPGVLTIRFVRE